MGKGLKSFLLKSLKLSLVIFLMVLFASPIAAGSTPTTEKFTDETDGSKTFSVGGLTFNITGSYLEVEQKADWGYDDNFYVDNPNNMMTAATVVGSFQSTSADFQVNSIYLITLNSSHLIEQSNDILIRGKLNGTQVFTHTVLYDQINTTAANNYYTFVDLSAYSSHVIDELEFEVLPYTTFYVEYLMIDDFKFTTVTSDTTVPTVADKTITSSSITQTGVTLSWNKATDDTSAQGSLQYLVYQSSSNNLDTVTDIEANGTAIGSYAADIATKDVSGLSAGTTYYFNIIVKDEAGNKTCYTAQSVTTSVANSAPVASAVSISGTAQVGQTLTGSYTYTDADSDAQGTSIFQWYRSDDSSGTGKAPIDGAANTTYTLTAPDLGKYISFKVTPVASAGTSPGTPVESGYTAAVTAAAANTAPSFVGDTTTLSVGKNSGATDIKSLLHVSDSDVGQPLTWSESAAPSHGTLSFAGATASSGSADITPGGTITYTPAADYTGSDSFTVQVSDGTATAERTINITVTAAVGGWIEDNGNINGINYDFSKTAERPSTVRFNGEWYAAWQEKASSGINQIRVAKRSAADNTWSLIDGGGAAGINKDTAKDASKPKLAVYNNKLYAAWTEYYKADATHTPTRVRVARYDGGSTWTFTNSEGLNYSLLYSADSVSVCSDDTGLYVAWAERNNDSDADMQLHVGKYNGTSWSIIGANSVTGLNIDTTQSVMNTSIASAGAGNLYVAWTEAAGSACRVHVKYYNGSSWTDISGGAPGLNYDPAKYINNPLSIAILGGTPYVAWSESNASNVSQVRLKKYSDSTWTSVDGGGETGLNYNTSKGGYYVSLATDATKLYLGWSESAEPVSQLRIKSYNPTDGWTELDSDGISPGGDATGINMDYLVSMGPEPQLSVGDGQLCAVFGEGMYPTSNIQFKRYDSTFSLPANADRLTSITSSGGSLYPEFNPSVYDYIISVDKDTTSVDLTLTLADPNGKLHYNGSKVTSGSPITISGLQTGDNPVLIKLVTNKASIVKRINIRINRAVSDTQRIVSPVSDSFYDDYGKYPEGDTYSYEGEAVNWVGYCWGSNTSVLKFDYSFISGNITAGQLDVKIKSVTDSRSSENPYVSLYGSNSTTWTIYSDSPSDKDVSIISGDSTGITEGSWKGIDVSSYVSGLSGKTATFVMEGNNAADGTDCYFTFYSEENPTDKPKLLVTFAAANSAPVASAVSISGTAQVGQTLTGSYTYTDADSDAQGTSTFQWYRSDDSSGTGKNPIDGATNTTYTLASADLGKYISFKVTPVASAGISPGTPVESGYTAAVTKQAQAAITYGNETKTYGDASFVHTASGGSGSGAFSYTSSDTSVATIDSTSGSITILKAGTTTLTATKAADSEYAEASQTCTLTVIKKTLTAEAAATDKIYNGTTSGTGSIALTGIVGTDAVTASGTFTFADSNVGTGITVNVTGITLAGAAAGNYTLANTTDTDTADITPKPLTPTATANDKTYDGSTTGSGTITLPGKVGADAVTASGTYTFADANAGTNITVNVTGITLEGAAAGNYQLTGTTAADTADITPKALTAEATASDKTYDGTTGTTGSIALGGKLEADEVTATGTFTFADANGGTGKTVNVTGITLAGAQAGNYTLVNTTDTDTADITPKSLTPTATANDKTYDGSTTGSGTITLPGKVGADVVTASGTYTFADANAGTNITVNVTGITLEGAAAGNYQLTGTTAADTADITPKALTAEATASDKTYDGSTTGSGTITLPGKVGADVVTASGTYTFASANAGTNITVNVTGITLAGAQAGNYTLVNTTDTDTADITPKTLTAEATAADKIYDGSTTGSGTIALTGKVGEDVVTASGTYTFASANAGTNITVNVTGITLAGAAAGNYTLANTTDTDTADITPKELTPIATAADKIYDGSTTSSGTIALTGKVVADDVTASGTFTFADAEAGDNKTVNVTGIILAGSKSGNYTLASTSASDTANITPKELTPTATADNKIYDGSTAGSGAIALTGIVGEDVVTAGGTFTFAGAEAGDNKTVNVTGITLAGAQAGNYTLASTTASDTANITPKELTPTATADNKIYDGSTTGSGTIALTGIVGEDVVTAGGTFTFAGAEAGDNKTVNVTGITLGGAQSGNYTLASTTASDTANITPKELTPTATADNKTYDGTTTGSGTIALSGKVGTDAVTASGTFTFADPNAGTGKTVNITGITLGGTKAGNYNLASTTASDTADIGVKTITAAATAQDKVYDGTTTGTGTITLTGVIGEDTVTPSGIFTFAGADTGTGITVNVTDISLAGAQAANYTLASTTDTDTADITPKSLTPTATANGKTYDRTTAASGTIALTGVVGADAVTASGTFTFADANAGTGKAVNVTGINLSGLKAHNYILTDTTSATTANITPKTLTATATANDKNYDGTTTATGSITLTGIIEGDVVTADGTFTFVDAGAGDGKTVNVTGITLGGAQAGNYEPASTTATTTANIIRVPVGIAVTTLPSKTTYVYGESLDTIGGVVTISYNDSSTATTPLISGMCAAADTPAIGDRMVTVTHLGHSTTFDVTYNKAPQTPPAAPTCSATAEGIIVTAPVGEGYEYSKDGGLNWQSETLFTGLTHATPYTITARILETATHLTSNASAGTTVTFMDITAPNLTGVTATRISDTEANVVFNSSEAGKYYYAVAAAGAAEPAINIGGAGTDCAAGDITIQPALTTGAKDIYIKVKDNAGNVSNALMMNISSANARLSGLTIEGVMLTPAFSSNETGYTSSVAHGTSSVDVQPTTEDSNATVTVNGNPLTGSKATVALDIGINTVTVLVTAQNGTTTKTYTVQITRMADDTPPPTQQPQTGEILVNGKTESASTVTTTQTGDQTVTTVVVDDAIIEQKLEAEGNNTTVTIPVNTQSDVIVGELNGQLVKTMENKQAVIEIKTESAGYTLPATQINIDKISAQIGADIQLKDIKVSIEIAKPTDEAVKIVENSAKSGEFTIVAPPVEFTVSCTHGDQTVSVTSFNSYVERTIAIPEDVDPAKITTGVVIDPDGTVRHVPTQIVIIDGKYYAKLNSLTNSTYSVIWHPLEFKDVENHWAKEAVNEMGSRMVISGVGNQMFEPDRDITRAEFATIIVKALGLKPGTGKTPFTDVSSSDPYAPNIQTAYEYNIISGYGYGLFGPKDKITREQAMSMIDRAMKVTGLKIELNSSEAAQLLTGYGDAPQASGWARVSMASCIKAGLIPEEIRANMAAKGAISRAEVAAIVRNLLRASNLI